MAIEHIESATALPARSIDRTSTGSSDPLRPYARTLPGLDLLALTPVFVATTLWGASEAGETAGVLSAVGLTALWFLALALIGGYDTRYLGVGAGEFTRILSAGLIVVAAAGTVGYLTEMPELRGPVVVAAVGGAAVLLLERRLARAWLHRERKRGRFAIRALVIGSPHALTAFEQRLGEDRSTGMRIVATHALPGADPETWLSGLLDAVYADHIDTVVIAPGSRVDGETLRALSWRLGGTGIGLLVAPTLGDLAGPRGVVRPAPRLPLVHLDEARLTGPQQALKRTGDVLAASIGLILLAPLLLLTALAVRLTSRGPILFRQRRVGRDGRIFVIAKFRTMVNGAADRHDEVLGPPIGRHPSVTRQDPRITPLGRFLRRWSIDELPQLWSVVIGDMSLVGPRPLMAEEMPWLEPLGQRRHLMRPGITGLWQVNGRKEVDWADRIRLDIDYIERWSPLLDFVLLVRTIKVILTGEGAR